ncbi:hypothetical protein COW80_04390, partial [Candidatus Beckwithbacteria bacterium CG22_combo_CG10-13_8_21_14_all_01_47_9]
MSPESLTIGQTNGQTIRKYLKEVLADQAGTEPGDFDVWKAGQFSESGAEKPPVQETKNWNEPPSEWLVALKTTVTPRGWNDLFSLAALGATEIGGIWGNTASGLLMIMNSISLLVREGRTMKQIKTSVREKIEAAKNIDGNQIDRNSLIQEIFTGTGLTEKEVAKGLKLTGKRELKYFAKKVYRKQTAFGKLFSEQESVQHLSSKEKLLAFSAGIAGVAALEGAKSLSKILALIPLPFLSSAGSIFISRLLMRYALPNVIVYAGKRAFYGKEANLDSKKTEKAREWTRLSLQVMSTAFTTLITAGYGIGAGVVGWHFAVDQLNQVISNVEAATSTQPVIPSVTAQPEKSAAAPAVITPLPTSTGTAASPTEAPPTATPIPVTETPSATPTETATATLEATAIPFVGWQPGVVPNDALLDQADTAGLMLDQTGGGVELNIGGKTFNLFRFDLDQKENDITPEVWAIENAEGNWQPVIWEKSDGNFGFD